MNELIFYTFLAAGLVVIFVVSMLDDHDSQE